MSGHTPGPWGTQQRGERIVIVAGKDEVASVDAATVPANAETAAANARLIASAPELLELLAEWRRTPFFEDAGEWKAWVRDFGSRVDAAIAKAEGPGSDSGES